jgi:hypothetical protein
MRLSRLSTLLLGVLIGVTATLLLDPRLGVRRRALLRDKARRYGRIGPRRLRGSARSARGPLRGAMHAVARQAPWREEPAPPDQDEYVKHRVETELGRHRDLRVRDINFDAADGVVRVRGTVPDEETARRIVRAAAAVDGVRAVASLLHTVEGTPIACEAGDTDLLHGRPRAATQGESVRRRLMERWPVLTDADIHASAGHPDRLAGIICSRTGQEERDVRAILDDILLAAV